MPQEFVFDNLDWYVVTQAITGLTEAQAREGMLVLRQYLEDHTYLRGVKVWWDIGKVKILVEIGIQATTAEDADLAAFDRLWDMTCAALDFNEGLHFETLAVKTM